MLHRYGSVAVDLARRLLNLQVGDRIDSVSRLAAEFGTGRGTIQSALKLLTDEGAVEIDSLGRRGSFVKQLNHQKLLQVAKLTTLIGAMPVAYTVLHQGLSTGLIKTFQQANIPIVLAQLRGAKNRLHFLRTGRCDFAIISRLSWQEEENQGDLLLLFGFGPRSNAGDHVLLLADNQHDGIVDGMKVGIDPSSHDHLKFTLQECEGKSVQLVEISYGQSIPQLLSGQIDVAIFDTVSEPPPAQLKMVPLRHKTVEQNTNTEAVLVVRADSGSLKDLILNQINPKTVVEIQRNVVAGNEKPIF